MKLPFTLPFGKKEKKEYFLALLLSDENTTAVILEEQNGCIKVINAQQENFPDTIEILSLEQLLNSLDKAISSAENVLPPQIETKKTIFGIKETWVADTQIKKEYLGKLKKVSQAFGLEPLGFLVIHEAVAHLLKVQEGIPVSAILLEVGRQTIALSVLRGGKVIETKRGTIEDALPKTTDQLLHQFTDYEVLPSRIIIFSNAIATRKENLEKISQSFITHTWSKSLPFLHVPQIAILSQYFETQAMLFGLAAQLDFTVKDFLPHAIQKQMPTKNVFQEVPDTTEIPGKKRILQKPSFQPEENAEEDFGFVKGTDVAHKTVAQSEDREKDETAIEKEVQEELLEETPFEKRPLPASTSRLPDKQNFLQIFSFIVGFLVNILQKIRFNPFRFFGKSNKLTLFIPLTIAVLILSVLAYIFGLKATVTLEAAPKIIEKEETVTFAIDGKTDATKKTIAAQYVTVSQNITLSTKATGKKEVGEKAKGSIAILSSLPNEQTLSKGTIVTSTNDLEFVLDDYVKIASSSGLNDLKSVKALITANNIGKEYNLPSKTSFKIGSYSKSDLVADNDTAFSGGSKKEITVVSKEDIALLVDESITQNQEKAKAELAKKVAEDETLLPMETQGALEKEEYSKKVGDEADSVTLKATITYRGESVKKEDISSFAENLLQSLLQDVTFSTSDITTEVKNAKKTKNVTTATLSMKASLLPKIDTDAVRKDIAGKSFEDAKEQLLKQPQAADVRIILSPPLPFLPSLLPKLDKNITIEIHSQ